MDAGKSDRRIVYRGRKIDLALQSVGLADGSTTQREVVLHRGAVAMVPMVLASGSKLKEVVVSTTVPPW